MNSSILRLARQNLQLASATSRNVPLPDPGWRWHAYRQNAMKWVNYFRTPIEVIHAIQSPRSGVGFECRMTGPALVKHTRNMEKILLRIFPRLGNAITTFAESELSNPDTITVLNDRLVSSPLYNHITHVMRCLLFVSPAIVAEIGGGYGAPARLWMTNGLHRPKCYIDIDFPESLYYAETYLRANFSEESCKIVYAHRDTDIAKEISAGARIILMPIANMDALLVQPIDLLVNTGSLQEMSTEYVDFYMKWIDKSKIQNFYSSNYFGQPIEALMEGMNYAAPVMPSGWKAKLKALHADASRPVAEMFFVREDGTDFRDSVTNKIHALLKAPDPIALGEFLELFDYLRHVDDRQLIIETINKALKMKYVPKEALFLARCLSNTPNGGNSQDRTQIDVLKTLEKMASSGIEKMGIVGATANKLRSALIKDGAASGLPFAEGRLREETDGATVEISSADRQLRNGTWGSVERMEKISNQIIASGWASGKSPEDKVNNIHLFLDGGLVESVRPSIIRKEFGSKGKLVGFEINAVLPVNSLEWRYVLLLAEFEDGSVGYLTNGGEIQ